MTDTLLRIAGDALNDAAAEFLLALEDQDQADSIADYEGPGDDDTAERAAVLATRRAGAAELRLKKCRMAWIEARALGGSVPSPSPDLLTRAADFVKDVAAFKCVRAQEEGDSPFNVCDYHAMEDLETELRLAAQAGASSPAPSPDPTT